MARLLRVEFEGALYHVTVRGVDRRNLFRGDHDRTRILEKLADGVERFDLDVFLYCLMPNHLHLLVGTPRGNLGQFMGWWLTAYTTYFNRKHRRHGHLTQGRYGAKLVEGDDYLLRLSRYLHLNPVQTAAQKKATTEERLATLRKYKWSSYLGYVRTRRETSFVRHDPLLALVGKGRRQPRRAYQKFVETGLDTVEEEWRDLQKESRIAIGSAAFIDRMECLYEDMAHGKPCPEDIALRRIGRRVAPSMTLDLVGKAFGISVTELCRRRRHVWDRAVASRCLVQHSGLTQREAAEMLGMKSGVAVGAQLRKLDGELKSNRHLRRTMRLIEDKLRTA